MEDLSNLPVMGYELSVYSVGLLWRIPPTRDSFLNTFFSLFLISVLSMLCKTLPLLHLYLFPHESWWIFLCLLHLKKERYDEKVICLKVSWSLLQQLQRENALLTLHPVKPQGQPPLIFLKLHPCSWEREKRNTRAVIHSVALYIPWLKHASGQVY